MPSFVPVAISAVESNSLSVLFYTRPDGDIAILTAQKRGEDPDYPPYKAANVLFDGNKVTASVPQVSAIAYDYNGNREVRLYYIGGSSDNLKLRELAKTNEGEWKKGKLDDLRQSVTKDTLISANVEDDVGDVKVFLNTKDDDDVTCPAVAWVVKGQTAWSSRIIGKWK